MKYSKPEIILVEDALVAVQSNSKPTGHMDSIQGQTLPSVNAYASDE
jgi:hypothetical protein